MNSITGNCIYNIFLTFDALLNYYLIIFFAVAVISFEYLIYGINHFLPVKAKMDTNRKCAVYRLYDNLFKVFAVIKLKCFLQTPDSFALYVS